MAQREEESDSKGKLPVTHQLAGGVVDGGDVVGVECVAHTQGVGSESDADTKCLAAESQTGGVDDEHQGHPANEMQCDYHRQHGPEARPFRGCQRAAEPRPPVTRQRRVARRAHNRTVGSIATWMQLTCRNCRCAPGTKSTGNPPCLARTLKA